MMTGKPMMSVTLLLAVLSAPAMAGKDEDADLEKAAVAYNATVESPTEEIVCKNEARIGSRIKRPVCRTKSYLKHEQFEVNRYMKKPKPSVTRDDAFAF